MRKKYSCPNEEGIQSLNRVPDAEIYFIFGSKVTLFRTTNKDHTWAKPGFSDGIENIPGPGSKGVVNIIQKTETTIPVNFNQFPCQKKLLEITEVKKTNALRECCTNYMVN